MPANFANFAQSTLSSAITNSATSLTVASASTFPASVPFQIQIDVEIMNVIAVAGNVFTLQRGQESTAAASHASAAAVIGVVTAAGLKNNARPLVVGASTPTGGVSGDLAVGTGKLWVNDGGVWKFTPISAPASTWFGIADPWAGVAFGSLPDAPAGAYWPAGGDKGGATFGGFKFVNRAQGTNVMVIDGWSNAIIDLVDFDTVPEGIYVNNCSNLTIKRLRAKNITGPLTRTGWHQGNLIQFAGTCSNITIQDLLVCQPHSIPSGYTGTVTNTNNGQTQSDYGTEDIASFGGVLTGMLMQRFKFDGGAWQSWSGTGMFLSDGDQANTITIQDGILFDPGQCAIGTGGGTGPFTVQRVDVIGRKTIGGLTPVATALQLRTTTSSQLKLGAVRVDWPTTAKTPGVPYTDLGGNDFAATLPDPDFIGSI